MILTSLLWIWSLKTGDYDTALEQAQMVLEKNEKHPSALATAAICCGLTGDPVMCKYYTTQAVENGYNKKKIEETIAALFFDRIFLPFCHIGEFEKYYNKLT